MNKVIFKIAALSSIAGLLATCSEQQPAAPDLSFEESLQQQLIEAQPGDVIEIPAGTHEMTRSLSLNVPGVKVDAIPAYLTTKLLTTILVISPQKETSLERFRQDQD